MKIFSMNNLKFVKRKSILFSIFLCVFLFSLTKSISQEYFLPTYGKPPHDFSTIPFDSLEKRYFYYLDVDLDSSLFYLQAIREKCNISNTKTLCAKYFLLKGTYYHRINNYDSAIYFYHQSRAIFRELSNNIGYVAANNNLGALYEEVGNIDSANKYLSYNLKFIENSKDHSLELEKSKTLLNFGLLYQRQKQYSLAEESYSNSLKIKLKHDDKKGLSLIYNNMAIVKYFQNDIKAAENYLLMTLKLFHETNDVRGASRTFFNLAEIYLFEYNDVEKAKYYYSKSYENDIKLNDYVGQIECLIKLSVCFGEQKNIFEAEKLLKSAQKIANVIGKTDLELEILEQLKEIYLALNNYEKAFYIQKRISTVKDSVYEIYKEQRLPELQDEYQKESKTKSHEISFESLRVEQIKQQGFIMYLALVLIFIAVLIPLMIAYINNVNKIKTLKSKHAVLLQHNDQTLFVLLHTNTTQDIPQYFNRLNRLLNDLENANKKIDQRKYKRAKNLIEQWLSFSVFPSFERKFTNLSNSISPNNNEIINELKEIVRYVYNNQIAKPEEN